MPERDDMDCLKGAVVRTGSDTCAEHLMPCVSASFLSGGRSCPLRIPPSVVTAAWQRQLARNQTRSDRFFQFTWNGGVWLAYGMHDGQVRGVCCPSHGPERRAKALAAMRRSESALQLAPRPTFDLAPGATPDIAPRPTPVPRPAPAPARRPARELVLRPRRELAVRPARELALCA